ncbi:hypothetical protein Tco_0239363, partial [Tanacetum coccineum]
FSDINLSFVPQQAPASQVINDVTRQLSFNEIELDGEAGFADVARSGVESSRLSHDESFRVDDWYETDIQEKDKKKAKNKQNRARNGKDKVKS